MIYAIRTWRGSFGATFRAACLSRETAADFSQFRDVFTIHLIFSIIYWKDLL